MPGPDSGGVTPLEAAAREIRKRVFLLDTASTGYTHTDVARAALTAAIEALPGHPVQVWGDYQVQCGDSGPVSLEALRRTFLGETPE